MLQNLPKPRVLFFVFHFVHEQVVRPYVYIFQLLYRYTFMVQGKIFSTSEQKLDEAYPIDTDFNTLDTYM